MAEIIRFPALAKPRPVPMEVVTQEKILEALVLPMMGRVRSLSTYLACEIVRDIWKGK